MRIYPFSYEVVAVNPLKESSYIRESGMGMASNYTEAVKTIEDYYGSEDIISIKNLELYEENELLILSPKVIEKYSKNKYKGIPCDCNGVLLKEE